MKIERIFWIIAVATLAILALNFKSKKNIVTEYLPGDTIFSTTEIPIPVPYDTIIYNIDTIEVPGGIDTVLIRDTIFVYNDYFKMFNYSIDTIIDEVSVISDIKITQNRLYSQSIGAKNNRKTAVLMPEVHNFGVGGIAGVGIAAPVISYDFKGHQVGIGYELFSSKPIFMYQYKFNFKK